MSKNNNHDFEFLNASVLKLLEFSTSDEILRYTGEILEKLLNDCYILILNASEDKEYLVGHSFYGIQQTKVIEKAIDIMGFSPVGKKFKILSKFKDIYNKPSLYMHNEGIDEFAESEIPKFIGNALEKFFGITRIYTIGLSGSKLLGTIHIFMLNNAEIENHTIIEAFIFQVSLALEKILMYEKLKKNEEKLKTLFDEKNKLLGRIQRQQRAIKEIINYIEQNLSNFKIIISKINEITANILDVEQVSVWFMDKNQISIKCIDLYKKSINSHSEGMILYKKDYPRYFEALLKERVIAASDAHNDLNTSEFKDSYLIPMKVFSMLDAPIKIAGEIKGIICFEHTDSKRDWHSDELIFAGEVADQLAQAVLDIENKKREDELIKAREAAEKASKAKSEFLANMSHEIRTPLNAIMGFANILSSEETEPDKFEMLTLIKKAGNSLLEIINDILDLSKIESGKIKVVENSFDIVDLLKVIVKTLKNTAFAKALNIDYEISENILRHPYFIGDEFKLKQILINLINNAIKFTEKGEIKVELRIKEKYENKIDAEFSVKDTGIGIPEDMKDKIFEKFVQAEHYLTKRYQGTGLGLAIVNNLIKIMGGNIEVKSEINKGSEFIFCLPLKIDKEKEAKSTQVFIKKETEEKDISNFKILAAEDDEINQVLAKRLAQRNNLNIEIVDNGIDVINRIKEDKFDIILMDIMMPKLDGKMATELIRKGEAGEDNKNIPIIGVTAHALKEYHLEFINAGMDYVITKPIDSKELLFVIDKFCN